MEDQNNSNEPPVEVRILKNGPLMIKGNFNFKTASGITSGEQELYLCRCGGSSDKPYCDGTHKKIGVSN